MVCHASLGHKIPQSCVISCKFDLLFIIFLQISPVGGRSSILFVKSGRESGLIVKSTGDVWGVALALFVTDK